MSDIPALALALLAGALLGVLFFGGLWWTVQKGLASETPALWFLGSLVLRTGLTLSGFYLIAQGDWSRFVACVLGFLIARVIVVRWLGARVPVKKQNPLKKEISPMRMSPDDLVFWRSGFVVLNSTIVTTWALMLVMTGGAMLITRRLKTEGDISRWQGLPRNRRHNDSEADRGGGAARFEEVSWLYRHLVSVHCSF